MNNEKNELKDDARVPGRRQFIRNSALGMLALNLGCDLFGDEPGYFPGPGLQGSKADWGGKYVMESAPGPITVINGKPYTYFGGTGYYALQGSPELIKAAVAAVKKFGIHPATSRSGFGNTPVLIDVEKRTANFLGVEDAFYFVSGYLGSLVLLQTLKDKYDVIVMDETAHFSVKDGAYTTGKRIITFKHRSAEDLKATLQKELHPGERPLLATDGVFPTYGVIAPIPEYLATIKQYNGLIAIDDAHSCGVLGPNGRGTYDHFGLKDDSLYFCGTLSKAFGGEGGFVCGTKEFVDNAKARTGVYPGATPTGTATAAAAAKGLEIVTNHPEMRQKLWKNVKRVKDGIRNMGFPMNDTHVPIVSWELKSAKEMLAVQKALLDKGICLPYSKYVGAAAGGVLRASIFSAHTEAQIDFLLDEVKKLV